ncbi:MAG: Crp/Fnr family transcriptional regulator [Oscillospiraceae bacterium]|nr:Crp/Fnr family transcriptional regulator [Oscillospiraceae bacterium]
MKKYIPLLERTKLFAGLSYEETEKMLRCLNAKQRAFKKGELVLRQGESVKSIMVLAEGKLHIQRDDHWGNRSIISIIGVSEMFGEAYAAPDSGAMLNDVLAVEDSVVLCFDMERLISVCPEACSFHSAVVRNLLFAISEKNRKLVQKLGYMSERTTREKLIAYLSDEAKRNNSSSFSIPFNRQQLADYLSVDRSALSNELSKMRNDGLLKFCKNRFELL